MSRAIALPKRPPVSLSLLPLPPLVIETPSCETTAHNTPHRYSTALQHLSAPAPTERISQTSHLVEVTGHSRSATTQVKGREKRLETGSSLQHSLLYHQRPPHCPASSAVASPLAPLQSSVSFLLRARPPPLPLRKRSPPFRSFTFTFTYRLDGSRHARVWRWQEQHRQVIRQRQLWRRVRLGGRIAQSSEQSLGTTKPHLWFSSHRWHPHQVSDRSSLHSLPCSFRTTFRVGRV